MSSNFNKFTIQSSFAISAGAGSGKTYTLSRRYINAVLGFDFFVEDTTQDNFIEKKEQKKAEVSQIVTITYTCSKMVYSFITFIVWCYFKCNYSGTRVYIKTTTISSTTNTII